MKHSSLSFQYLVHGVRDSANAAQPTVIVISENIGQAMFAESRTP